MPGETVLLAGGAGYIGNHTTIEIVAAGYSAVVIDNLVNSSREGAARVEKITGKKVPFHVVNLLDTESLRCVFKQHKIAHVIHFASLKAVGESCLKPLEYYENNFSGTINLLKVMREFNVKNIIFSSSATVYGTPEYLPIDEKHPVGQCTNPYGRTKYFIEQLLTDLSASDESWNVVILRYFNPVGAHKSGLIGEDPQGAPNNLMPYVAQVAVGRRPELCVYGDDYKTPDGTGVRDYIHVVDLAIGHVAAIKKLQEKCRHQIYNLGTGVGYSVLDMVKAFEKASGRKVPYKVVGRRTGDVDEVYADATKAKVELGWTAERGLDQMCEDLWHWQELNPKGFEPSENGIDHSQSSL